jgi:hypothetical protein
MSNLLKSLKFTTLPTKKAVDPVQEARNKLIARLEDQKAMAGDPAWTKELKRWRKNKETGKRETVTEVGKPRPTWVVNEDGVTFFIKKGHSGFVEFGKGQCGIAVKSESELPKLIETLIAAVRSGELDEQLKAAPKSKKH